MELTTLSLLTGILKRGRSRCAEAAPEGMST